MGALAAAGPLLTQADPVVPMLSLLGNYFLGFDVSWAGVVTGMAEAGLGGFGLGWVMARLINRLVDFDEGLGRLPEIHRRVARRSLPAGVSSVQVAVNEVAG